MLCDGVHTYSACSALLAAALLLDSAERNDHLISLLLLLLLLLPQMMMIALALVCDAIYGPYQSAIVGKRKKDVEEAQRISNAPGVKRSKKLDKSINVTTEINVPVDISCFHLMFNMNAWQGLFSLIIAYAHGDLPEFVAFVERQPTVVPMITMMCITMACGNIFIFAMQRYFGSLEVTITTTVRKLVSVLLSVFGAHGALC